MQAADVNKPGLRRTIQAEHGFSLIELLIVVAIIMIIAAIALPNFIRARMAANEAAAASNVRTLTTAAVVYSSQYNNGLPPSLSAMGAVSLGSTVGSCDFADLIDPAVASGQKSGYQYIYTGVGAAMPAPAPGCSAPGYTEYLVTATPLIPNFSGVRSFCSDEPGVLHFDPSGNAPGSPTACATLPTLQ
ncbi:MAG: prepilin-type N-terminal cleavage/methylation domain-containing protein [Candidatus Acidiferrales bacterium]